MNKLKITTPILPFPSISFWKKILAHNALELAAQMPFEKMTYTNRYYIATAHGKHLLSIPLAQGRNQKNKLDAVNIFNEDKWAANHWRTITSAYQRAPYFEHYAFSLEPLFTKVFDKLIDFNLASMEWCKKHLQLQQSWTLTDERFNPQEWVLNYKNEDLQLPRYYQLFEDRNGFIPSLSIIDLLMMEGPNSLRYLHQLG